MIQNFFTTAILTLSFSAIAIAQEVFTDTTKRQTKNIQISKRIDSKSSSITPVGANPVLETTPIVDVSQRTKGNQNTGGATSEFPKPATKSTDNVGINSAKYVTSSTLSELDNLLNMIELKNNINDAANSVALKNTPEYIELKANIVLYRSRFDNHIQTQGFENCSTREQNFYLSFLKDENKMEEYNLCLSKIK